MCLTHTVYEDIRETIPSVHENPAYEKHFPRKVKLEKNPAYDAINKPITNTAGNPSGNIHLCIDRICTYTFSENVISVIIKTFFNIRSLLR